MHDVSVNALMQATMKRKSGGCKSGSSSSTRRTPSSDARCSSIFCEYTPEEKRHSIIILKAYLVTE
jgi:hypothetical protein